MFITIDLTPKEQVNKKLRKELNKEGRIYYIKKQQNSEEESLTSGLPLCTDNNSIKQFSRNKNDIFNIDSNLSIAVLNYRSIVSNKASFADFIENHHPDIVIGTESWLSPTILSCEAFLPIYIRCLGRTEWMGMEECSLLLTVLLFAPRYHLKPHVRL